MGIGYILQIVHLTTLFHDFRKIITTGVSGSSFSDSLTRDRELRMQKQV